MVSLLYKMIDLRNQQDSTARATSVEFGTWIECLGEAHRAMALTGQVVEGAINVKTRSLSYRARTDQPMKPRASTGPGTFDSSTAQPNALTG